MAQLRSLLIPQACHNLTLAIHLKTAALAPLTLANKLLPGRIAIPMKRHSKTHIDQQHIPTMDPLGNVLKFLRSRFVSLHISNPRGLFQ